MRRASSRGQPLAQNTGCVCVGVELEPKYVAVVLHRMKEAFGLEPELLD